MAKYLDSKFGKVKPYKNNPRVISDAAFTKLCASMNRDPEYMACRPIVIDENNAILGGNQRQYAILSLNETGWSVEAVRTLKKNGWESVLEGRLPDEWVRKAEGWTDEKKLRFVLIDNSPEGMAGEFDYDIMSDNFTPDIMAESGIDFSNLSAEIQNEAEESSEEKAEKSDYGEKSEKLKNFKENREKARESLDEMTDASCYLCFIFQTTEQKREFLAATDIPTDGELFASGLELARRLGVAVTRVELKFPEARLDKNLTEMAMPNGQKPQKTGEKAPDGEDK